MEVKKETTLFRLFLYHLVVFCIFVILSFALNIYIYMYIISSGYILPANYSEKMILKNQQQIISNFDESLISKNTNYMIVKDENILKTNMDENQINDAKNYIKTKKSGRWQYIMIKKSDGSDILFQYKLESRFKNKTLDKILPKPEAIWFLSVIFCFVIIIVLTGKNFSRILKKQINHVLKLTDSIEKGSLDFKGEKTKIKEFNSIISALEKLKTELSNTLMKKWSDEKNKNIQISSLTHDIKTPLTIIKGNAEFLLEDEKDKENIKILNTILESETKIEEYVRLTLDSLTIENQENIKKEKVKLLSITKDIISSAEALLKQKNAKFEFENQAGDISVFADKKLIERALINIISNSADKIEDFGNIRLNIKRKDQYIKFEIEDDGPGFSMEALNTALDYLYSENKQRSGDHYGMGLFIANTVAKNHGGFIEIGNRKDKKGAVVKFYIQNRY